MSEKQITLTLAGVMFLQTGDYTSKKGNVSQFSNVILPDGNAARFFWAKDVAPFRSDDRPVGVAEFVLNTYRGEVNGLRLVGFKPSAK